MLLKHSLFVMENKFRYWVQDEPIRVCTENGWKNDIESKIVYSGEFNPMLLRGLSHMSINLINRLKGQCCYSEKGDKSFRISLFAKNLHSIALDVKNGKYEIVVWSERFHSKSGMGRNKTYFNDMEYKFYLKPKGERLNVRPSTGTFDFKNRLNTSNLECLMSVYVSDERGF